MEISVHTPRIKNLLMQRSYLVLDSELFGGFNSQRHHSGIGITVPISTRKVLMEQAGNTAAVE